jgi:hypothetical protein
MPTKKFAIERGGPERIEVTWKGIWKELKVSFDGRELGSIEGGMKAVKQGKQFVLPDGGTLDVKLVSGFANTYLQLLRNGQPLPGSGSDPAEQLKVAWGMIFFIAALNGVVGLIAIVTGSEMLANLGIGWPAIVLAAFYAGLALLVKHYRSSIALGIAVVVFGIDGILSLAAGVEPGHTPPVGMLIARVFFILPMIRGFAAIRALKQDPRADPTKSGAGTPRTGERRAANDPWQGPDA